MAVGHDMRIWTERRLSPSSFAVRHAQAFGNGTTEILRTLSVAVVGCSGTGSGVVEQLARLGVGRIVLVDPDIVEEKNLNRILNSGKEDVYLGRPKVHVLASAIARMGLGQEVIPLRKISSRRRRLGRWPHATLYSAAWTAWRDGTF
jgi:tRNA A37 threonylcarbamoyladenosine dehydratase